MSSIEQKQKYLKEIGENLKKRFHGIDTIIDKIIDQIETWYLFDDLLYRPTVINLFGLTATGKSTLVKDLVKSLNMYEKFIDIDLGKSFNYTKSTMFFRDEGPITSRIYNTLKDTDEKGILLIDEIQKMKDQNASVFNEIWGLLSDGKIGSGHVAINKVDALIDMLESEITNYQDAITEFEYMRNSNNPDPNSFNYSEMKIKGWNPITQPIPYSKKYYINNYLSSITLENFEDLRPLFDYHNFSLNKTGYPFGFDNILKKMYENNKITLNKILELPNFAFIKPLIKIAQNYKKYLIDKYNKVSSKDPLVFSKLLIFITGNVNDLYLDSKNINISADELHQKTMKLTTDDLKNELLKIFKPEEVSRFGGNFIIFPSLSSEAFRSIIIDKLEQIEKDVKNISNIKVKLITDKYLDYLERASIVASLGARPVISRIYTEINIVVPKLIKTAKLNNLTSISIDDIDFKTK
jgi:cell division protease FtsH